jgi:iron complex outermembrane receptor protein
MITLYRVLAGASLGALALGLGGPAMASEDAGLDVSTIIVTAARVTADTVPTLIAARAEVERTPGGADLVEAKEFSNGYAVSFHDMLAWSPGVFAQPRFGEEVRLSIRGSGLGRSFHLRGVTLLQDGAPISLADGSGDFQELDPETLQHISVYRGANALRFGSSSLGGAVNAVTVSGQSLDAPVTVRLEGGSFETLRGSVTAGFDSGSFDGVATVTASTSEGFRQQSAQDKLRLNGNLGVRLAPNLETRFYVAANRLDQEVPGTVTLSDALNRPRTAPAINIANDYARNIRSLRLQNRTAWRLGETRIEFGAFANFKSLYHPIFQVIDQDSTDWGGYARVEGRTAIAGMPLDYIVGSTARVGRIDAKQFVNVGGQRGALTADAVQKASTIDAYGELRLHPVEPLALIAGLQFVHGHRALDNRLRPAASDARDYDEWAPKLGLLWSVNDKVQLYANVSRSAEIPTFSELVQQPVVGFVPLAPQTAWTMEIGTRGEQGPLAWDVSLYRSRLDGELLQFTTNPDIPAATFNAGRTIHQGVEARLDWTLMSGANQLVLRQVYQLSDFRFRDDPQYGGNRLPAAPMHIYRGELRYSGKGFSIAPNIEWTPRGAWADYRNSVRVPGYALIGAHASVKLGSRTELFLDARNLMDKNAVVDLSAVVAATPQSTIYYPTDGRAIYGGMKLTF